MIRRFRLPAGVDEQGGLSSKTLSPEKQLRHFRKVTSNLMQDAVTLWAELWGEFEGQVTCGVAVLPEAERGFEPECGWPEFLEKMWLLRYYLDFAKRLSEDAS